MSLLRMMTVASLPRALGILRHVRAVHTPSRSISRVGFITDVEGNLPFFTASTAMSSVVRYDSAANRLDFRDAGSTTDAFVYGGDCFDKGEGDIRVSRALVDFKRRYPDRVFLLIGNRDLNKMKIYAELDDSDVYGRRVEDIPKPFWIPGKSATGLSDYLARENKPNNTLSRAQYYFNCTMGMGLSFEGRRRELAALGGKTAESISEEEVLQSFISGVRDKDGFYRQYLENAQIGVCIGDTLFVHGSVTEQNMGFLPNQNLIYGVHEVKGQHMSETHSVQEWIDALNAFGKAAFEDWVQNPLWNKDRTRMGGAPLLAYGHRLSSDARTVVVSDWTGPTGNLSPVPQAVENYLKRSGIRRVLTGHKPLGDSPAIIRSAHLEVIDADTSFSDPQAPDNRGCAVNEVVVEGCNSLVSRSFVRGVLRDGSEYEFYCPSTKAFADNSSSWSNSGDPWVGKQVPHREDWWVRAKLKQAPASDVSFYHVANVKGFEVLYNRWSGATAVEVGTVSGRDGTHDHHDHHHHGENGSCGNGGCGHNHEK